MALRGTEIPFTNAPSFYLTKTFLKDLVLPLIGEADECSESFK